MTGPTMVMAPAVDPSSPTFPRSHSTPELMSLPSFDTPDPNSSHSKNQRLLGKNGLPSPPSFDVPSFNSDFELDTSVFLRETKLSAQSASTPSAEVPRLQSRPPLARSKTGSVIERPRSWFPSSKPRVAQDEEPQRPITAGQSGPVPLQADPADPADLRRLGRNLVASDSFANFAKRSWMSASRSPLSKGKLKPATERLLGQDKSDNRPPAKLLRTRRRQDVADGPANTGNQNEPTTPTAPKALSRASTYLTKIKQKQVVTLTRASNAVDSDNSCASSAASFVQVASSGTGTRTSQSTTESHSATTDESSSDLGPASRDTLWSSFKALDVEFKAFPKQIGQRIIQVQAVLLPFLKSTVGHPSTKSLSLEDVERRAIILNQWWVAILEMLDGQGQHAVPGVDRPTLLETLTLIMTRPEWRLTTPSFRPLAERSPAERLRPRSWTNSSTSTYNSGQAALLAESAEHNVRTMFVSNLVKQMAFVVDKMSMRHAPLNLVNFAGKTCAYAFFFAPGVADILIRLWGMTPELLRRTADHFGLPRRNKGESDDIAALFPPKLGVFRWSSAKAMWDTLKQIPKLPVLIARIPWTGPWVSRWKGRDTDLFFVFCKYFHVLSDQFTPPGLPLLEKARSPAFALVQAQLLSILDTSIRRQPAAQDVYGPPLVDSFHGSDAAAMSLPLPPTNLMKGMSENRLIILLKDFLSDDSAEVAGARHTFAEAFAAMMKATACVISQFDNAASFTLCDFLEEALVLYSDFEDPVASTSYIDWNLWLEVFKRMLSSLNTMSEVRMLSLIFTIWDAVAKDPRRKAAVCLDWLLTEDTFDSFFNHWCPMVRAYYHRLLCWRICRDEGSANDVDASIFLVVAARLKTVWSHYLYLRQAAEEAERFPPSTAPVLPAPGKKFMIIRQELNTPQPGLFMGFDSSGRPSSSDVGGSTYFDGNGIKSDAKKRWSLLGKMLSFTSGASVALNVPVMSQDEPAPWEVDLQAARRETAESRTRLGIAPRPPPKLTLMSDAPSLHDQDSMCSSPTYEERKYIFKFILSWHQSGPPRDRILTRPRLPAPAQSWVTARARNGGVPPQPAGMPAVTRTISGDPQAGLVQGAKNAGAAKAAADLDSSSSTSFRTAVSGDSRSASLDAAGDSAAEEVEEEDPSAVTPKAPATAAPERMLEPMTQPEKPTGIYVKNTVYTGRALSEWSLVVYECNNFIDRRRDEGVLGLREVEVPLLGVEGFRRLGS